MRICNVAYKIENEDIIMAIKVIIKNFENIQNAQFVIEGLTAFIGESTNGKTATYNAIKVLTYNIQGQGYVRAVNGRKVKGGCQVGLMFDSGTYVMYGKVTSPMYSIKLKKGDKPKPLDKVGRSGTPEEAATLLNMDNIEVDNVELNVNFLDQFSPPILKSLKETQLYKIAVKSFDGEKIQEAVSLCKVDLDKVAADLKVKEESIVTQKRTRLHFIEQLEKFNQLEALREDFKVYEQNTRILPILSRYLNTYEDLKKKLKVTQQALGVLSVMDNVKKSLQQVNVGKRRIEEIRQYMHSLAQQTKAKQVLFAQMQVLSVVGSIQLESTTYNKKLWERKQVLDYHNQYLSLLDSRDVLRAKLSVFEGKFDSLQADVVNYKENRRKVKEVAYLQKKRKQVDIRLSQLHSEASLLTVIQGLGDKVKKCRELTGLKLYDQRYSFIKQQKQQIEEQLEEVVKEITHKQYMVENKICPLCGEHVKDTTKF